MRDVEEEHLSRVIPRGHYIHTPIRLVGNSPGARGFGKEDQILLITLVYLDTQ